MIKIQGTNITHMRGDTDTINVALTVNGSAYTMSTGDKAVFSVKSDLDAADYVFQIPVADGKVKLEHATTQGLAAGGYVWDIQLTMADGTVQTIGPGKYKLLADVTNKE